MQHIDESVKREIRYILTGILFFSALMQIVFLILSSQGAFGYHWTPVTLLSCLYTDAVMFADFFWMALTVQKVLNMTDQSKAQLKLKSSASVRSLLKLVFIGGGALLVFTVFTQKSAPDLISLLLPVFFPRITIAFRSLLLKKKQNEK